MAWPGNLGGCGRFTCWGCQTTIRSEASQVNGGGKFRLLHECLYGPMFAQEHPALFPLLTDVVTGVPFFSLRRPSRRWSADEVAHAILGGTAAVGR